MLQIRVVAGDPREVACDLLVVGVFTGGIESPGAGAVREALGLDALPVTPDFRGESGQSLVLAAPGMAAKAVLLVGLGRMDAADPERLRRVAAVAARAARGVERVATTLVEVHASPAAIGAVAEGFQLGAHTDHRYRSTNGDASRLREVVLLAPSSQLAQSRRELERALIYAGATIAARDLVDMPPGDKRPAALAEALGRLVRDSCDVHVRHGEALVAGGFNGIVGVGRGSTAPPQFVELRYRPRDPLGHVVLAGKGITFDSGGLQLKRGHGMDHMKNDMAGAAAVAAACSVLADLGVRVQVTGLLALAENMPGGDAQRPGDVLRMFGGTTVEVLDTDAEGRLVLADALAYGASLRPDAMIDLATLTGAAIGALGPYTAALMGTDKDLLDELQQAASITGEQLWPLPLPYDLERFLRTPVADLNNTGDDHGAGSIMGGLFLKRFTGKIPWAHIDLAGPSFLTKETATHYLPEGASGFGVRTLLAWLERRAG